MCRYLHDARQVHQQQIQYFPRVEPNTKRDAADAFILAACLIGLHFDLPFELLHVLKVFALAVHKLCVLFVALYLHELNLDRATGDDSLTLGQKLLAYDAFE